MADQNQQVPAGVTFGAPVQADTPVNKLPQLSNAVPAGVTLGTPVAQDTPVDSVKPPQSVLGRVWDATKGWASDAVSPIKAAIQPPQDAKEETAFSVGGEPALEAYRASKAIVGGVENTIKSHGDEYHQAKKDFIQGVQDFHNKNYGSAATDSASVGGDVLGMMGDPLGPKFREISEGTRPNGDLVTPLTRDALDLGAIAFADKAPEVVQRINPFRKTAIPGVADNSVAETSAPSIVKRGTNLVTGGDIQPKFQSGIRDTWNNVADTEGVPRPKVGASVRDMGDEVADSILARSKAAYKQIDDATNGRFSSTEQALRSVNQDLRSVTNDAEEQRLTVRKTRLEMQMDQMMDDAAKQGVTQDTVNAAKADFKKAQAMYDTSHQIQMATKGVRPGMRGSDIDPEVVDANSAQNRLNKLATSGRLQQAVGDDAAEDFISHSAIAKNAAKNVTRNRVIGGAAVTVIGGDIAKHALNLGSN